MRQTPKPSEQASDQASQNRHPASWPIEELLKECTVTRTRGSGPGGQHRNKVETAIVITHQPSGIVGQASEKRSQHRNHEVAVERLRKNLALGIRSKFDDETGQTTAISDTFQARIKSGKLGVSQSHFDFAVILAEVLDWVCLLKFEVGSAADRMGVSTSQLVKFLKQFKQAFEFVNQERQKLGMKRLN